MDCKGQWLTSTRYGLNTRTILLARLRYDLGQLATSRNSIWLAGTGLHAFRLVRSSHPNPSHHLSNPTLTSPSATATKTSWITLCTGVSYEKLQVFHRWTAYAFMVLALMHTFPFIVWHVANGDLVDQVTVSNVFEYWTGIVALVFQAWLTFASWGPFR